MKRSLTSSVLVQSARRSNDSPQQGDLRLSGPPSGQGAGAGARTRDRRVPADLRADSLATVPPTPPRTLSGPVPCLDFRLGGSTSTLSATPFFETGRRLKLWEFYGLPKIPNAFCTWHPSSRIMLASCTKLSTELVEVKIIVTLGGDVIIRLSSNEPIWSLLTRVPEVLIPSLAQHTYRRQGST
ncbi:hypothetical protein PoB_007236200 [Plakobranchus ocellatus]|uniref:Uncharacterized protein n=1 Tax=Plakobranchus ocellatus TaxID=259542 RepID=A0AAV4DNC4_9GAST|nr:hypothetical protein PoB_007236200 [Plakobranchus ocellatus]